MSEAVDTDAYRGVFGAVPYAFRRSDSRLFKLYAVVGAMLALLLSVVFLLSLVVFVGETVDTSATLSLSRSFVVVVGLLTVMPILAPILFVARRHRRGIGHDTRYDRRLALAGFAFICSIYVGLVVSTPPAQQVEVTGPLAPVVDALYALPPLVGLVPPVLAALSIYAVHRLSR